MCTAIGTALVTMVSTLAAPGYDDDRAMDCPAVLALLRFAF
jgi:hypothetical protein